MGGPALQQFLVWLHEVLLCECALLEGELIALDAIVGDLRPRVVLLLQSRSVDARGGSVRIVDLRSIDLLKRLHRADGTDELQIGIVIEQVAAEVERERCHGPNRHEVADRQPHSPEVVVGQREIVLPILDAKDRVVILGPTIGPVRRDAQANDRRPGESFLIYSGVQEVLEQLAVQNTKVGGDGEFWGIFVDRWQKHAEIEIADIGREVVPHNPLVTFAGLQVGNLDVEDLEQREFLILASRGELQLGGDDLELDGIPVTGGVVPVREIVESTVDHPQDVSEILLTVLASGKVGEVCGGPRTAGRRVVLVEAGGGDAEREFVRHERPIR